MKRKQAPVAAIAAPVVPFPQAETGRDITEPTVYDKLDSFKKELDAIADLCRGGRWARAVRNIKDMQKDLGALAKSIQVEYLEEID